MGLFEKLTAKAKASRQRIVLPEGTEPRTLTAADRIIAEGIADIILIGDPKEIKTKLSLTNTLRCSTNSARKKVSQWKRPAPPQPTRCISAAS